MKTLALVMNSRAGRARALAGGQLLDAIMRAADWAELTVFDAADDVPGVARAACASGADAVVIAGGDGTAATVLDAARHSGCGSVMVPLPLGTANMLPRRLYGERGFEQVLRELPGYRTVSLHAGEAAGRIFFVALMAGAPVRFGQAREALRPDRKGRRFGEAVRRIRQGVSSMAGSRLRLQLEDGERRVARSGAVFISPGGLAAMRGFEAPPGPEILEHVMIRPGDPADLAIKTASFLTGRTNLAEATICSPGPASLSGPKRIHLMLDGEVVRSDTPVEIRLIENAARFAAPASAESV